MQSSIVKAAVSIIGNVNEECAYGLCFWMEGYEDGREKVFHLDWVNAAIEICLVQYNLYVAFTRETFCVIPNESCQVNLKKVRFQKKCPAWNELTWDIPFCG